MLYALKGKRERRERLGIARFYKVVHDGLATEIKFEDGLN